MTLTAAYQDDESFTNPVDLVEQIVSANDWAFDRRNDEELAAEIPGKWCNYSLYFAWREDMGAMHFTCAFDMKVPVAKRGPIWELLAIVNEKLWLGHFGLWDEEGVPMFRHTSLLRGGVSLSPEQIEDLVDLAITECERFYPAFQFVIWGGKSATDAVAASLLDTVGEA
ncbi:MAG: YbjN domain-containing protein [Phaeospirillum sp.]|nr:YbjN domain-containing protein [Phaeospirillum sp.]